MKEIEKKYLIDIDKFNHDRHTFKLIVMDYVGITQWYIVDFKKHVLRGRTTRSIRGEKAYLTYKGPNKGITRTEIEFRIPVVLAKLLRFFKKQIIQKQRTIIKTKEDGKIWEVDNFYCMHPELHMAEIELSHEGEEHHIPSWATKDVSDDPQYYNSNLVKRAL